MSGPVGRFISNFFDESNIAVIFFLFLLALFIYIIIPSMDTLMKPFGFQTKEELKQTVIEQQKAIEQIQQSNTSLETHAQIAQEISTKVIEKAVEIQKQQVVKSQKLETINRVKYKAIQKVYKDNPPTKTKTAQKTKSKHPVKYGVKKAVSNIQITAIWDTYCLYNNHKSCH